MNLIKEQYPKCILKSAHAQIVQLKKWAKDLKNISPKKIEKWLPHTQRHPVTLSMREANENYSTSLHPHAGTLNIRTSGGDFAVWCWGAMHAHVRAFAVARGQLLDHSPRYSFETGSPTKPGPRLEAKSPSCPPVSTCTALAIQPCTATPSFACGCWDPHLSPCVCTANPLSTEPLQSLRAEVENGVEISEKHQTV